MNQKNTNKSLLDYRIENPHYVSEVELAARYAIDIMNAPERFRIGYSLDNKFIFYDCRMREVKGKPLFCIVNMTVIKHKIGKLLQKIQEKDILRYNSLYSYSDGRYSFDDYYEKWLPIEGLNEKLSEQLVNDNIEKGVPVYLIQKGRIVQHLSYRYALQKCLSSHIFELSDDYLSPTFKENYKHMYLYPDNYENNICLYGGETCLARYSKRNDELFCVPLTDESLSSEFWNGRQWRDIIPETNPDADICGIPVKYVTLKTYIDGYQNIFISVYGINGKPLKNSVLDNAFVEAKDEDTSITEKSDVVENGGTKRKTEEKQSNVIININGEKIDFGRFERKELNEKEIANVLKKVDNALSLIFDCDIFIPDTNIFVYSTEKNKGKWANKWIFQKAINIYWAKRENHCVIEINQKVYDEIQKIKDDPKRDEFTRKSAMEGLEYLRNLQKDRYSYNPNPDYTFPKDNYADKVLGERCESILREESDKQFTLFTADGKLADTVQGAVNRLLKGKTNRKYPVIVTPIEVKHLFWMKDELSREINNNRKNENI